MKLIALQLFGTIAFLVTVIGFVALTMTYPIWIFVSLCIGFSCWGAWVISGDVIAPFLRRFFARRGFDI